MLSSNNIKIRSSNNIKLEVQVRSSNNNQARSSNNTEFVTIIQQANRTSDQAKITQSNRTSDETKITLAIRTSDEAKFRSSWLDLPWSRLYHNRICKRDQKVLNSGTVKLTPNQDQANSKTLDLVSSSNQTN